MQRIKGLLKKVFTPITIMVIPHSNAKSLNLKVPSIGVFVSIILWSIGMAYVFSVAIDALEYQRMKQKLDYYSGQFLELRSTISTLKRAEVEFERLFSLKSKEKILENLDISDSGSIDMQNLKDQIKSSMENIGEIRII